MPKTNPRKASGSRATQPRWRREKVGQRAPFYIDQEAPPAPGGLPKVGPLKASLPNNHLQYAVTCMVWRPSSSFRRFSSGARGGAARRDNPLIGKEYLPKTPSL